MYVFLPFDHEIRTWILLQVSLHFGVEFFDNAGIQFVAARLVLGQCRFRLQERREITALLPKNRVSMLDSILEKAI